MKLIIDIDDKSLNPQEGDVITFHDDKWQVLTHTDLFSCEQKKILELEKTVNDEKVRIQVLEEHIKKLAIAIKEK